MSEKNINLILPGNNLLNCFGIQPSFHKSGICKKISLFSLYSYKKWYDNAEDSNVYYAPKLYTGFAAQERYNKAIDLKIASLYGLNLLLNKSLHVQRFESISALKDNPKQFKDILLYYSELLKYKNRLNKGNFFITSDKTLYNNIKFAYKQLYPYSKYIIEPTYLEENLVIIGCRGNTSFDNPIIASPFLEETDFSNLRAGIIADMSQRFPFISKMNILYDGYQKYIKEKMPTKWHFEIFKNPEMYYITLHFKP